jgi:uncharacterized protein YaaQ
METPSMKMIMAVVPHEEAERVLDALITAGHTATFVESRGGMLRQSQWTLFIAVHADEVDRVLNIIQQNCHIRVNVGLEGAQQRSIRPSVMADLGGAVSFVWDLDRWEKC